MRASFFMKQAYNVNHDQIDSKEILGMSVDPASDNVYITNASTTIKKLHVPNDKSHGHSLDLIKLEPPLPKDAWIRSVEVSPSGLLLAIGTYDGHIGRLSSHDCSRPLIKRIHQSTVYHVKFLKDEKRLASVSADRQVVISNVKNLASLYVLGAHNSWVQSLVVTPDYKSFFSGDLDGNIYMYNSNTCAIEQKFVNFGDPVMSLDISPDQKYLVAGDSYGWLFLFDLINESQAPRQKRVSNCELTAISFSNDGCHIVCGFSNGHLKVICTTRLTVFASHVYYNRPIPSLRRVGDQNTFIAASDVGRVVYFSLTTTFNLIFIRHTEGSRRRSLIGRLPFSLLKDLVKNF